MLRWLCVAVAMMLAGPATASTLLQQGDVPEDRWYFGGDLSLPAGDYVFNLILSRPIEVTHWVLDQRGTYQACRPECYLNDFTHTFSDFTKLSDTEWSFAARVFKEGDPLGGGTTVFNPKYQSMDVTVERFAGPFSYTLSYDMAAVPEPMTWAMMITGFGLAGGALRRHAARAYAPGASDATRRLPAAS